MVSLSRRIVVRDLKHRRPLDKRGSDPSRFRGVSYLVLARKYRPAAFAELVGQEHVTRTLANAIAAGPRAPRVPVHRRPRRRQDHRRAHPRQGAVPARRARPPTPCGVCEPCEEIAAGSSVDVIEIDGASNTGVDETRAARGRALPARPRAPKVYIIDEVHMLSADAFNALLKTLEEPPPHVVFVFATTEPHKIPVTILSRCQRYDFKLVPTARLTAAPRGDPARPRRSTPTPEARARSIAREAAARCATRCRCSTR